MKYCNECLGCESQLELFNTNYVVHIQDSRGRLEVLCNTEDEVWDAIGRMSFDGLYQVSSPTGLDVSGFVPF